MKKQGLILFCLAMILCIQPSFSQTVDLMKDRRPADAVSQATPLATQQPIPEKLYLFMGGRAVQPYRYPAAKMAPFPTARVRHPEIAPNGDILGTYIYSGIPIYYFLDRTTPLKLETDAFDRPLDMMVVFAAPNGIKSYFSYGELTMASDAMAVMVAYYREPLLPTSDPAAYKKNTLPEEFTSLRVLCPKDKDNTRNIYNVLDCTLEQPAFPDELLPKVQKGTQCKAATDKITCIADGKTTVASFDKIPLIKTDRWVRIGHGQGIKNDKPVSATGFGLRSFLQTNFPGSTSDDFFLFVGCDGYRALFSGREIFDTVDGESMMIINSMNGEALKTGYTLGPISDFFVDRAIRELSHIVRIRPPFTFL